MDPFNLLIHAKETVLKGYTKVTFSQLCFKFRSFRRLSSVFLFSIILLVLLWSIALT